MITIPTLSELKSGIEADLEAEYGTYIPAFGKAFLRALAAVQAAKLWLMYKLLARVQKNVWPDLADPVSKGGTLERFGLVKLGRNPYKAVAGVYTVQVQGTIGATIAAQTTFKSTSDSVNPGQLYILDASYTLTAVTDTITLRALTAGTAGKLDVGDTLSSTVPLVNVNKQATVLTETTSPTDAEGTEDYRDNILQSFRLEPQGGAGSDYRLWGSDVTGVKQIYPYAKSGEPAEVDVYVESTTGDGAASAPILAEVADALEIDPDTTLPDYERGRRPLGVFQNNVYSVTPLDVDIVIDSYESLTAAKQAAILAEITTVVNAIRPYIPSVDISTAKNDILDINKIISTILTAQPGSVFGTITLSVDSVSLSTYTFDDGYIPYLNSVTYT